MIVVKRENDTVIVEIETDLKNNCEGSEVALVPFAWKTGMVYTADLLYRYIQDRLYRRDENIRRQAYNQGWKDAKAHSRKQKNFGQRPCL